MSRGSRRKLEDYFDRRFGVDPSCWDDVAVYEKSDSLWIVSADLEREDDMVAAGLRALRDTNLGWKPTTYVLQWLDDELAENVYVLDDGTLERLVFERERIEADFSFGYVALRYRGKVIGCGLQTSRGLETQVPKGRSRDLAAMLR